MENAFARRARAQAGEQTVFMGIITLLTDFGTEDEYVGVVKGVILQIDAQATIIDISHHIAPQGIDQAGDMLRAAYPWFPKETIHVVVVDPGVGSERAVLAVRQGGHTFIAPDNGVLTALWDEGEPEMIVAVENTELFLQPVSRTFHGRDIFAPVAAQLSLGMDIRTLGPMVRRQQLVHSDLPRTKMGPGLNLVGQVVGADRFGNILTNIDARAIDRLVDGLQSPHLVCTIGGYRIVGLSRTYAGHEGDQKGNQLIALIGSRNRLEIAVNGGDARQMVGAEPGLPVSVSALEGSTRNGKGQVQS